MLVSAFKSALSREINENCRILTCDANPYAPGLIIGDIGLCAPSIESTSYPDWLIEHCQKYNVSLLLTLMVSELSILENIREKLSDIGCKLVGIPCAGLNICRDKVETSRFCNMHGIAHPRIWVSEEILEERNIPWPIMAKHRFGQGSKGQCIFSSRKALEHFIKQDQKSEEYIYQEFLEGTEYGLDVINDLEGNYKGTLARRKIAMRAGETDIAVTEDPTPFQSLSEVLGAELKHGGILDVDIICRDDTLFLLDLNPRFGGGYPFSHLAGADLPAAYIRWAAGKEAETAWLKATPGVVCSRISDVQIVQKQHVGG